MTSQILLETKLVGDIKGTFLVPSYQRGYRWGRGEVRRLLDDIYQNGKKNYCLQPIVIRNRGDVYELIDGQQRLTTLYLIYKYMCSVNSFFPEPAFHLIYETREKSEEFLRNINRDLREDNIDFWFIVNAFEEIRKWFEEELQIRVIKTFEYLKEDVKVIWYEVGEEEDAISMFTRLNVGKISLTSAELVKAMFLSADHGETMTRAKQDEIALQWDNMEKELHNSSLWYFLTNKQTVGHQTRIDLILDLIAQKPSDSRDLYFTFFQIDRKRKETSTEHIWRKIQRTFLTVKDWYENHELYHKIGYLIASDSLSLQEIYDLSEGETKQAFKEILDECIKYSIDISGNYADLSYDNPSDYKKISRLLLLFNVESVRQNGDSTQWFPFDHFKDNLGKEVSWSLEHIHAQQSEGLRTQEMWKKWLELHLPSVKEVARDEPELIMAMQRAIDKSRLERQEFEKLQHRALALLSEKGGVDSIHSIGNLALLKAEDNAALNNSAFDVKRNMIIDMDRKGKYIPYCTKMVFLKYYSPSSDIQLHFWGRADRIEYLKAINQVLDKYLQEHITDMEENVLWVRQSTPL